MPEYMVPQKTVTLKFLKDREGHEKGVEIQVDEREARRLIDAGWATTITREGATMTQPQEQPQKPEGEQSEQQGQQQQAPEQQPESQNPAPAGKPAQAPPEPEKKDH